MDGMGMSNTRKLLHSNASLRHLGDFPNMFEDIVCKGSMIYFVVMLTTTVNLVERR